MKNQKEKADQPVILNNDVEFENSAIDPGFEASRSPGRPKTPDTDSKNNPAEQGEQGTQRGAPGLGELDGTNPGSNHHPMD